jgi:hypothetical protein
MTFAEALGVLSDSNRQRIEDVLRILGQCAALYYRAVCSVECESRLLPEAWKAVFDALLTIKSDEPNTIRKALIDCLRDWTLSGPPLVSVFPRSYGRAVTVEYFCRVLVDKGYFGSVSAATRNIRSLLLKPHEIVAKRWRQYYLGKHLMWSTFSTEPDQENPFMGMPDSANAIRGILGLDPNEKGEPLLLMIYSLPANVIPRFPTIAEAFAGEKWSYFFTPAPRGASYGMTMPWPEYEDHTPRPEVVHKLILGAQIVAPLVKVL